MNLFLRVRWDYAPYPTEIKSVHTDDQIECVVVFATNLSSCLVPVERYASQTGILDGEVGSYKGVRFIETTNGLNFPDAGGAVGSTGNMSTGGTNLDVYATIIFAKNAYGEVPLSGTSSAVIIKVHGDKDTSDTSDPLNQRGSAGKHDIDCELLAA